MQCSEYTICAVHSGEQVRDWNAYPLWVVWLRTSYRHQAGLALNYLVIPGAPALWSVMSKAGDREHDQPLVELMQRTRGETESAHDTSTKVIDQYVGSGQQSPEDSAPIVRLQIEGDGLLVPITGKKIRGLQIIDRTHERRSPAARIVTGNGRLDLDHAHTEVAEHHGCVRTSKCAA